MLARRRGRYSLFVVRRNDDAYHRLSGQILSIFVEFCSDESSVKAPYPRGKGEVCKTFMHRFDSDRRLVILTLSTRHAKMFKQTQQDHRHLTRCAG